MDISYDPRTDRGDTGAAFGLALVFAAIYWLTAALGGTLGHDEAVYFDHLADSFLHGRLDIEAPPVTQDLAYVGGRWYVPFPPGPALLLMPAVAAFGPASTIETHLLPALGGLNVGLVYLVILAMRRRRWVDLDAGSCVWIAGLFGLGTGHWALAATPRVWFIAQVVTVSFVALAVLLAIRRANPVWIGLALALAIATRPDVVLALPFFVAELVSRARADDDSAHDSAGDLSRRLTGRLIGRLTRRLMMAAALLAPIVLAGAALLTYNRARFGDPLEFGYSLARVDPALAGDLQTYGQFSLHYLGRNLQTAFAGLPQFHAAFPYFTPSRMGMSVFLATPALIYLFRRLPAGLWAWGAWAALALIQGALLLYYNTGWQQFGYRFSLDYVVFALCLVAANAGRRISPLLAILIVLAWLINLRGVVWWFGGD